MKTLIAALVLSVAVMSMPACQHFAPTLAQDELSCAKPAIADATASALVDVKMILDKAPVDWHAQLDALRARLGDAVICAVQVAIADFQGVSGGSSGGRNALVASNSFAAERGQEWLADVHK